MAVELKQAPARQAIIVERKGMIEQDFKQAATEAFRVLASELKRLNGWSLVRERIGICPDEASLVPDAEARYQAGFIYEGELPALNEDVRRVTLPAGTWAISVHQGPYETSWQSWNRLYRDWLPASGYRLRAAAPFEVYLNHPKKVAPDALRTEIWIPLL